MNETHHIEIGAEVPAFMKEDWIVKALHELDTSSMSPDRRADLSIFLAKELSERHFNHNNRLRAEEAEANLEIERAKAQAAAEMAQIERAKSHAAAEMAQVERAKSQAAAEMAQVERAKAEQMEQKINLAIQNLLDQPDWSDARIAATFQVSLEHIQHIRNQKKA
jgi:multidrug efflux pump subunit AcrA (membrane-fusion protein)